MTNILEKLSKRIARRYDFAKDTSAFTAPMPYRTDELEGVLIDALLLIQLRKDKIEELEGKVAKLEEEVSVLRRAYD